MSVHGCYNDKYRPLGKPLEKLTIMPIRRRKIRVKNCQLNTWRRSIDTASRRVALPKYMCRDLVRKLLLSLLQEV